MGGDASHHPSFFQFSKTFQEPKSNLMLEKVYQKRDYQLQAIEAVFEELSAGTNRQLVVMATGLGKTFVSREIASQFNHILFIAHREELIDQAYVVYDEQYPLQVGIIKEKTFEVDKKIVVASVQTLTNRLQLLKPDEFDLVIIDELHHYMAPSYLRVAHFFQPQLLIGLTATPHRLDGLSLHNVVDKIVFEYGIDKGVVNGWLCELDAFRIRTGSDLSKVKRTGGDFAKKELSVAVDSPERNRLVAEKYVQYAGERQAIVFAVDVRHAINLCNEFRLLGINADYVVSDEDLTPERKQVISDFKAGRIQVLTNCMILCLDLQTEILTLRGWLKHDEIRMTDGVANYQFDGTVFFEKPKEIIRRNLYLHEKMVAVKTKQSDIRVTSTHRMIHKSNSKCKEWIKSPADDLVSQRFCYPSCGYSEPATIILDQPYQLTESQKKRNTTANAYNLRKINGYTYEESRIEARKRVEEKAIIHIKSPNELSLDECRLIGFWLGDGSVAHLKRQGVEYTLCQSKAYPNIVKYIDDLLFQLQIDNIKRDKGDYFVWSLPRGTGTANQKRNGIISIESYLNKQGTPLFWGLGKDQLLALIEGLWYADGNHLKAEYVPETKLIGSTFYELLSWIQALCVCRGIKAGIMKTNQHLKNEKYKELYVLTIGQGITQSIASSDINQRLHYDETTDVMNEKVWCVKTTSKNIITRRNGKVCIMGNTEGFDHCDIGAILMARPTQSLTVYMQAIGRGTRLKTQEFMDAHGKNNCIILDFVDNTGKHELINTWSLDSGKKIEDMLFMSKERKEAAIVKRDTQRKILVKESADKRINLLKLPVIRLKTDRGGFLEPASEKQLAWMKSEGVWQEGAEYTKGQATEYITNFKAQDWQLRKLKDWGYDIVTNVPTQGQYYQILKEKQNTPSTVVMGQPKHVPFS